MVNKWLQIGVFLLVATFACIGGFYLSPARLNSPAAEGAGDELVRTSFVDFGGKSQTLSQWRGKVLVVNFWATWCAPCIEEIPTLMRVQKKYAGKNIQMVGIGIDNVDKMRDFATKMGIDYVLLIGGTEVLELSKNLGNRAAVLPFTVILDRAGKVAYRHAGALTDASFEAILAPLF
jgi:thiol-disulfide isomerase/thioredoxin